MKPKHGFVVTIHSSVPLPPVLLGDEMVNRHIFAFTCDDLHTMGDAVHFMNASIGTIDDEWVCDFVYVIPPGHSVTYAPIPDEEKDNEGQPELEFDAEDHLKVSAGTAIHPRG